MYDIEKDARPAHPGVVFYQERGSRYTIAVEREGGCVVGTHEPAGTPGDAIATVWRALRADYPERRQLVPTCRPRLSNLSRALHEAQRGRLA